ncbi:MAG: guanylate kinase [Alphaproteobacteria bacterium]|jgi:guanylate kinase
MYFTRRGLMLALSSPSGAGKTTLAKILLMSDKNLVSSVSVTTREPRKGEMDGKDYYFITPAQYEEMAYEQLLLEHAIVHENYYGTPRQYVEDSLSNGKDVVFDIDWQGVQQLRANVPQDLVSIFIMPPDAKELRRRLEGRATDSTNVVEKRLAKAASEVSHWGEYDYVLINDNPEKCSDDIRSILTAERLKRRRQTGITEFVRNFNKNIIPVKPQ